VVFATPKGWEGAKLQCREQFIKHAPYKDGFHFAYIAETYFSDLNTHYCHLVLNEKKIAAVKFEVKPFVYKTEKLKVDYRKISLSKRDLKRVQKEQKILNEIYTQSSATPYFKQPFQAPLNSFVTSVYGIRRVYNNAHRGQHLGTDFRAAIGVPVPAVNAGKVLFAGDLFYTGGTVIIDHGMDIFSVYGHLSEWKTQAGAMVQKGEIIGLSGNTGRSSGPHLHWGVKIHGHYIDGYSLIEESKKHFP
jgi:murein DD-endopeptidase MepM/ murein hydrolase activator NlpD